MERNKDEGRLEAESHLECPVLASPQSRAAGGTSTDNDTVKSVLQEGNTEKYGGGPGKNEPNTLLPV